MAKRGLLCFGGSSDSPMSRLRRLISHGFGESMSLARDTGEVIDRVSTTALAC